MKIFINPGHCPGIDSGAVSTYYDLTEADVVAEIGEMLRIILEDNDVDVMLEQSNNLCGEDDQNYLDSVCYHANDWDADFFVSLHCNAFNRVANGTEVFYGGETSHDLAQYVQRDLTERLDTTDRGIKDGNHLMVIRNTNMPAILIEIAFIDNIEDCKLLIERKGDIAKSIADSLIDFIGAQEG